MGHQQLAGEQSWHSSDTEVCLIHTTPSNQNLHFNGLRWIYKRIRTIPRKSFTFAICSVPVQVECAQVNY